MNSASPTSNTDLKAPLTSSGAFETGVSSASPADSSSSKSTLKTAGEESSCFAFIGEWLSWIVECLFGWICPSANEKELTADKKLLIDLQESIKQKTVTTVAEINARGSQFPESLQRKFAHRLAALGDQERLADVKPKEIDKIIKSFEEVSNKDKITPEELSLISAAISWLLYEDKWAAFYTNYLTKDALEMSNEKLFEEFTKFEGRELFRVLTVLNRVPPEEQEEEISKRLKDCFEAAEPVNKDANFKGLFHGLGLS